MKALQLSKLTTKIDDQWRTYSRPITRKLTDAELLSVFPEAKQIIPPLLLEFNHRRRVVEGAITERLATISAESADESYRYFWRKWVAVTLGEELYVLDRHISRLSRLLRIVSGKPVAQGSISDDMIQSAREVPVEDVIGQPVRRSGQDFVCACPFHEERTPSFHIYTQENRGWCFGCNQGGDSIDLYMRMNDCNFKDAVLALVGGRT